MQSEVGLSAGQSHAVEASLPVSEVWEVGDSMTTKPNLKEGFESAAFEVLQPV
jgi:hypothetical protein